MRIYFAPLEGITGYIQRQTFATHFGCVDKYFIPFIQPKQHGHFTSREKKDIFCFKKGGKDSKNSFGHICNLLTKGKIFIVKSPQIFN